MPQKSDIRLIPKSTASSRNLRNLFLAATQLLCTLAIFITDISLPLWASVSALYCVMVFFSWLYKNPWAAVFTATLCTGLILASFFLVTEGIDSRTEPINRVLALIPLWVCAGLVALAVRSLENLEISNINLKLKVKNRNVELKRSENLFREMIDGMEKSSVIRLDKKGVIETWPKSAENNTLYTAEEVLGKNFSMFFPQTDRDINLPEKFLFHALFNDKAMAEGWILRKDKTMFWSNGALFAMKDNYGNVDGFTLVVHDLSYRLKNEQLQRQNAVLESRRKEMGQFVFVASHDLKEPLRNLKSLASTLGRKINHSERDPVVDKMLQYMQQESDRAEDLITGLTEYASPGTEKTIEKVNLEIVVEEVFSDVQEKFSHVSVKTKNIEGLPTLSLPKKEIKTLFNQLITNAFKFGTTGSELFLSINANLIGDKWVFIVEDKGKGIPKESQDKVFALFQIANQSRKDRSGRGLGLAIGKKIVESMFGEIWLDETYDNGCRIKFTLPINLKAVYELKENNVGR